MMKAELKVNDTNWETKTNKRYVRSLNQRVTNAKELSYTSNKGNWLLGCLAPIVRKTVTL
jgi:hypothetical protein